MDCFLCWGVDFTVGVVEVGMGVKRFYCSGC